MKHLTSSQIRQLWLDFFKSKQHYIVPSSSLIPIDDNSLLFINSGVATLKNYFSGKELPPSKRMTNSQKAIRTGDIDNIGITARHHTMFEMLGNFSIGDYFKKEAIEWAYELLTSPYPHGFGIPKEKLYVTLFEGDDKIGFDQEAYDTWTHKGILKDHVFPLGRKGNFWDMGQGPCGPCTEIFYDRGEKYSSLTAKQGIGEDIENDRYIEIWNIVFSMYNNDGKGNYSLLPQKNIDTGAGLERIVSVLQDTPTNFETDLFKPIIEQIQHLTSKKYVFDYIPGKLDHIQEDIQRRFKAIADFSRTITFAIADGVVPSNTGRGYVIRRLLRRAITLAKGLDIDKPFISTLVPTIAKVMGDFYPNLITNQKLTIDKIIFEEENFFKTLNTGIRLFEQEANKHNKEIPANIAFRLFETYGLPLEYILELSKKYHKVVNVEEFNKLFEQFQQLSSSNANFGAGMEVQAEKINAPATKFIGYDHLECKTHLQYFNRLEDKTIFISEQTPFYATKGGQEHDNGFVEIKDNNGMLHVFEVVDVTVNAENQILHTVNDSRFGTLITALLKTHNGDINKLNIELRVEPTRRNGLMKHHSTVHLFFAALEKIFKQSVPQVGSKVEQDYFRMDIALHVKPTEEVLLQARQMVHEWIKQDVKCKILNVTQKEAKEMGATFLDGTKYPEIVRVVIFENGVDTSLCGGTHVKSAKEIEEIDILPIESKGSGIYRITGFVGKENIHHQKVKYLTDISTKWQREAFSKYEGLLEITNKLQATELHNKLLKVKENFDNFNKELIK